MPEILTPARNTLGGVQVEKVGNKNPYLNILLYGDAGTGKTVLAGSADAVPEMRNCVLVDMEGGTESLRRTYPGVDAVRCKTWKDMQRVYDELHRNKDHGYETVIVDSLTETMKFNMYDIMTDLVEKKTAESKFVDPDIASVREWGKNIEQMRKMIRGFRDLPMHTIFTALAQEKLDQKTGVVSVKPSLSGKLADEVAAFLDIVGYYYIKELQGEDGPVTHRILLTQKTSKHIAKDRTGKLPTTIIDPDMKKLYEIMYKETTS